MQRKNELSLMNIIFCMLVVFIHVSSAPVSGLAKDSWQFAVFFVPWRLSAFVVQGFIFLSGLKMFLNPDDKSDARYYFSRFRKVVIPYIFAVVLFYAYFVDRNYFEYDPKSLLGYILKGDLVAHFYFVIAIVQFYLLKPLWKLIVDRVHPKIAIPVSIILMLMSKHVFAGFMYNDRLFTSYIAYWIMGCYIGKNYDTFLESVKKYKKWILGAFAFAAIFETLFSYRQFTYGGVKFLEELHFLYCTVAIFFILCITTKLGNVVQKAKLLRKIDNASYYIYLIHPLMIFLTNESLTKWRIVDIGVSFVIRCAVTYVVSITLSIAYSEAKRKIKRKIQCRNSEKQK